MFFYGFLHHYFFWHYTSSLVGYIRVSRNFWWYIFHLFSIAQLTATLFSPYKRIIERPAERFSFENILERVVLNFFSRVVGLIIRLCIIIIGFCALLLFTTLSLAGFAFWLGAPLLILFSFFAGCWLLII